MSEHVTAMGTTVYDLGADWEGPLVPRSVVVASELRDLTILAALLPTILLCPVALWIMLP